MKRLYRSDRDTKLAGICGGLREELGIDGNMIRLMVICAYMMTTVVPVAITYIAG